MPKQKSVAKKTRLNLQVSEDVKALLEDLTKKSGASSLTEVIRRALAYYDVLVEHNNEGGQVVFRHKDGTEERVRFL